MDNTMFHCAMCTVHSTLHWHVRCLDRKCRFVLYFKFRWEDQSLTKAIPLKRLPLEWWYIYEIQNMHRIRSSRTDIGDGSGSLVSSIQCKYLWRWLDSIFEKGFFGCTLLSLRKQNKHGKIEIWDRSKWAHAFRAVYAIVRTHTLCAHRMQSIPRPSTIVLCISTRIQSQRFMVK